MRIKNRLRELRKKSGLTLEELSVLANTTHPQIYRLENSQRDLSLEWIDRLSKALKCKPYEILPEEWQPAELKPKDYKNQKYIIDISDTGKDADSTALYLIFDGDNIKIDKFENKRLIDIVIGRITGKVGDL
jgi:transcriptional regulator with XRE-family HTH domain